MAHMLACLRFTSRVSATSARLATGAGGLTLGRAGFAPAGRHTKFHGVICVLQFPLTHRAWSHYFSYPLFENDTDARHRHWLVCEPLCLWTGSVKMVISTFETLPLPRGVSQGGLQPVTLRTEGA